VQSVRKHVEVQEGYKTGAVCGVEPRFVPCSLLTHPLTYSSNNSFDFQVHNDCLASFLGPCSLGPNHVSILPPTAIRAWDMCEQGRAEAVRPPGSSPLLVFVNSKSGDNEVQNWALFLV
jgi:hypothetical protein